MKGFMKFITSLGHKLFNLCKYIIKKDFEIIKYALKLIKYTAVFTFISVVIATVAKFIIDILHPMPPIILPNLFDISDITSLIAICLTIGLVEEGLFRYLIYDCILKQWFKFPIIVAMFISASLFGLAHFNNALLNNISFWYVVPQVVMALIGGLFFVYIYEKVGLHLAILTHAAYDFLAIYFSQIVKNSLYVSLFAAIGGIFFIYMIKNKKRMIKIK